MCAAVPVGHSPRASVEGGREAMSAGVRPKRAGAEAAACDDELRLLAGCAMHRRTADDLLARRTRAGLRDLSRRHQAANRHRQHHPIGCACHVATGT